MSALTQRRTSHAHGELDQGVDVPAQHCRAPPRRRSSGGSSLNDENERDFTN